MNSKKTESRTICQMARSSLKAGRLKNMFAMVTIFLSVSLLTVVLLFAAGSREETKRQLSHSQHATYFELTPTQLENLKKDERIHYWLEVKTGITTDLDGYSVTPWYVNELSDEIQAGHLQSGTLPQKKNQAAVQQIFLERLGVKPEIGAVFEIDFFDGSTEQFEVSGILEGQKTNKNFSLMLSRPYAEEGSQLFQEKYALYTKLANTDDMGKAECQDQICQIGLDAGVEYKNISPSKAYLDSLGSDPQMLILSVCVGAVILLACILVIYGIFYISVVGRIHQFGQLRTIGMTKRQIKRLIKQEGRKLFFYAVPFGLLTGGLAGYVIKPDGWSLKNTAIIFIAVTVLNYLITLISIIKPASIAANISPMEAIRYNTQDEMKKSGRKKECRELTPLKLGVTNFSKNRKKTVITLLSLGLGGILFMTAAIYMSSFNQELYSRDLDFKEGEFNVFIPLSAIELHEHGLSGIQSNSPLNDGLKETILKLPGVKNVMEQTGFGVVFDYEKNGEYNSHDSIIPLTDEDITNIEQYTQGESIDIQQFLNGNYVFIRGNHLVEEIYGWRFERGDKIKFHYWNGTKMDEHEVIIGGFLKSDYKPMADGWFFMADAVLKKWVSYDNFNTRWIIDTEPEQELTVGKELEALIVRETNLALETLQDRREMDRANIASLFGAISGLSAFIMMFSILSMMNTLITNIVTRKQELAMLESIGMTSKQRQKMILAECFSLAGINLLVTLTIGTGAGYALCCFMGSIGAHYIAFRFPVRLVLGYAAVLFAVPAAITFISLHLFSKESLVDRLRKMEC